MILVPPELWEKRSQSPPPPLKRYLKAKIKATINGLKFIYVKTNT